MKKGKVWLGLFATGILLSTMLISATNVAMDNEMLINDALDLTGQKISTSKRSAYADDDGNLTDEGWARMIKDSYDFCVQEEEEGSVLLKNENNAVATNRYRYRTFDCFHPLFCPVQSCCDWNRPVFGDILSYSQ